jgi:hypothetical protein
VFIVMSRRADFYSCGVSLCVVVCKMGREVSLQLCCVRRYSGVGDIRYIKNQEGTRLFVSSRQPMEPGGPVVRQPYSYSVLGPHRLF